MMASHTQPNRPSSIMSPKPTTIDLVGGIYCHICNLIYANKKDYDLHYTKHETGSKDIVYTCVVCRKEISGYPSFRGHCYTSHVIKERFKCEHCSKLFSKFASLREHVMVMHRFRCNTCKKEFTSKKELKLHEIIHNDNDSPPYECKACGEELDTLEDCKNHIDVHSAFIYFCPICNENISNKENSSEHLKKHFGCVINTNTIEIQKSLDKEENSVERLGGISCSYCSQTYKNRMEFDAHFSCDHGDKDIIYSCIVCAKQFEKYSVFSHHAYNHFTKGRFCCDICLKTFNRLSLLVTHTAACQTDAECKGKPFTCYQCGHRYVTEMRLREHLRDIHGVHCVICPEEGCQEVFATPKELVFHQREHQSNRNWCRQCGLLFTGLASCERHLDVHKKKLYVCPVCNKNYSEKHLILKHISQHFETVLHICKVCGKVYNAKNRLIEHFKSHSENKTHGCTYCDKSFVKIGQLQQHLNIHTGSKPYKCPVCSKTFASYPNWHKHLRRMHNSDGKNYKKQDFDNEEGNMDDENAEEYPVSDRNVQKPDSSQEDKHTHPKVDMVPPGDKESKLDTYIYYEPNDSTMESDSIDHTVIEKELEIFENTNDGSIGNITKFVNVLATNNTVCVGESSESSAASAFPAEYGPEFSGVIDLDDHMLPHIDPLLINSQPPPPYDQLADSLVDSLADYTDNFAEAYAPPKWEPIITKVYQDYSYGYGEMVESNRLSIMNTDIF